MKRIATIVLLLLALMVPCSAALLNLGPGSFTPLAPVIDFTGPTGVADPSYNFLAIPGLGNITVSFGPRFQGQTIVGGGVKTLTGAPTNPLTLLSGVVSEQTFTANDGSSTTNPVLSGSPTFNGPISIFFNVPVAAVGLKGGFFNTIGATSIEAYDANGVILGAITNSTTGFEFYGLKDSSGANVISGVSFYITGNEPAGFAIDNVTFGSARQINPEIPEPTTYALMATGLLGLAFLRRRKA